MGRETASKEKFQSIARKQNLYRFFMTEEAIVTKPDNTRRLTDSHDRAGSGSELGSTKYKRR